MLQISLFTLTVFLATLGTGDIISKLLRMNKLNSIEKFWLGTVSLVIIFQFYSLFQPINYALSPIFLILIIIGIYSFKNTFLNTFQKKPSQDALIVFFVFLYLVLSIIVAASFRINWYDTDLYHLNAVRYIFEYKAIPGLVHIHSRLGFNSSFFVYNAVVESFTLRGASSHLSLTLFGIVTLYQWIHEILLGTKKVRYFCFLTIPFVLYQFWRSSQFPSLSTDLAAALISLQVFYLILSQSKRFLIIIALATLAVTVKFSSIALLPMALAYVLYVARRSHFKNQKVGIALAMIAASLLLLGFVFRNIVLSGWIVFPSPTDTVKLNVPWAASIQQNSAIAKDILGWARLPGERYLESLDQSLFTWLVPWLGRNQHTYELSLLAVGSVFYLVRFFGSKSKKAIWEIPRLIAFLGTMGGLIFWFVSAPDIRFASVLFWVLVAVLIMPQVARFKLLEGSAKKRLLVAALFTSMYAGVYPLLKEPIINLFTIPNKNNYSLTETYSENDSGTATFFFVPSIEDVRCGDSALPCAPYGTNFRLIDGEDLTKGIISI